MEATQMDHTPESLATGVLDGHRELARERYRFLVQLREFDLHRAYKGHGPGVRGWVDTPDWLQSTCGMPRDQGQEALRVAYTLLNLPRIEAAFEAGELSYAKVRALATVATLADEASLLALARVMSDAQVAEHCARLAGERTGRSARRAGSHRSAAYAPIYCAPVSSEGAATHAC